LNGSLAMLLAMASRISRDGQVLSCALAQRMASRIFVAFMPTSSGRFVCHSERAGA